MNRYLKLINYFQANPREGFNERHHIIPKCMNGTDDSTNLILLPPRVHFLCHYILYKAYPENRKLAHAFAMMGVNNPYQKRTTSKLYEKSKIARSSALKGIPRPEWVKEKLRKPKSNKSNYGKKPISQETRKKLSESQKGKKHWWQNKVISSEGYVTYQKVRTDQANSKKQFHRENFTKLKIKRKEYYVLFPEISNSTLKRYLHGL